MSILYDGKIYNSNLKTFILILNLNNSKLIVKNGVQL